MLVVDPTNNRMVTFSTFFSDIRYRYQTDQPRQQSIIPCSSFLFQFSGRNRSFATWRAAKDLRSLPVRFIWSATEVPLSLIGARSTQPLGRRTDNSEINASCCTRFCMASAALSRNARNIDFLRNEETTTTTTTTTEQWWERDGGEKRTRQKEKSESERTNVCVGVHDRETSTVRSGLYCFRIYLKRKDTWSSAGFAKRSKDARCASSAGNRRARLKKRGRRGKIEGKGEEIEAKVEENEKADESPRRRTRSLHAIYSPRTPFIIFSLVCPFSVLGPLYF